MIRPVLPLGQVLRAAELARLRGVSAVATGPGGFVSVYRVAGRADRLPEVWVRKRDAFIRRHVAQAQIRGERWYDRRGRLTRRALALMVWAYDPR